jgi:hypothetical protein
VPSFLSKPARLFYRAGFGPGPKTGLRAGLTGLVLFGHLYLHLSSRISNTHTYTCGGGETRWVDATRSKRKLGSVPLLRPIGFWPRIKKARTRSTARIIVTPEPLLPGLLRPLPSSPPSPAASPASPTPRIGSADKVRTSALPPTRSPPFPSPTEDRSTRARDLS